MDRSPNQSCHRLQRKQPLEDIRRELNVEKLIQRVSCDFQSEKMENKRPKEEKEAAFGVSPAGTYDLIAFTPDRKPSDTNNGSGLSSSPWLMTFTPANPAGEGARGGLRERVFDSNPIPLLQFLGGVVNGEPAPSLTQQNEMASRARVAMVADVNARRRSRHIARSFGSISSASGSSIATTSQQDLEALPLPTDPISGAINAIYELPQLRASLEESEIRYNLERLAAVEVQDKLKRFDEIVAENLCLREETRLAREDCQRAWTERDQANAFAKNLQEKLDQVEREALDSRLNTLRRLVEKQKVNEEKRAIQAEKEILEQERCILADEMDEAKDLIKSQRYNLDILAAINDDFQSHVAHCEDFGALSEKDQLHQELEAAKGENMEYAARIYSLEMEKTSLLTDSLEHAGQAYQRATIRTLESALAMSKAKAQKRIGELENENSILFTGVGAQGGAEALERENSRLSSKVNQLENVIDNLTTHASKVAELARIGSTVRMGFLEEAVQKCDGPKQLVKQEILLAASEAAHAPNALADMAIFQGGYAVDDEGESEKFERIYRRSLRRCIEGVKNKSLPAIVIDRRARQNLGVGRRR